MPRFSQHAALDLLLEQRQYESCRMVAERLIDDLLASIQPASQPVETALQRWQEHDLELGHLHLILSKCLFALHNYESAALKADSAALLARKANDMDFFAEALHVAGVCNSQAGRYQLAVQNFTAGLAHAVGILRAKVLYNRGHAYERMCAYRYAATDYDDGAKAANGLDADLTRMCRMNLAWMLILLKEFSRAEEVLAALSSEPGAEENQLLHVQLAHDRLHMAYLMGQVKDAVELALSALRQCSDQYPHVKAQIALTLVSLSADQQLPAQAVTIGLLAKRLAGQAKRPELDEAAGRRLQELETEAGTECFVQSLHKTGQVSLGATGPRRYPKRS